MLCPEFVPAQRGNKLYVDFDIESPYGTPIGQPKYFPLYDTLIPGKVNSNPRSASIASRDMRAPRLRAGESTFDLEGTAYLTTGDTSSEPPDWMDLLRICGFKRLDLPSRTSFYPTKAQPESASFRTFMGDTLHVSNGCRGTFLISATVGQFLVSRFGFSGLYEVPVESPIPTSAAVSRQIAKLCGVNFAITPDGSPAIRPVLKSISISSGGELASRIPARNDGKVQEVYFRGDRSPTWSCIIETNSVDEWFHWYDTNQKFQIGMSVPTSGKSLVFSTIDYTAQLNGPPSYTVDRGVRTWNLQFLLGGSEYIRIDHS